MDSSRDSRIEAWFPNLKPDNYEITSPETPAYNCIAWAAGRTDAWWEPAGEAGYFWPDDAPRDDEIESLIEVFQSLGFEKCDNADPESAYEKIAVYGDDDAYQHAARQIDGGWTSKLGRFEDIVHKTLDGLAGPLPAYGQVVVIMRRKIEQPVARAEKAANPANHASPQPDPPTAPAST
jgi:hypothetical protein